MLDIEKKAEKFYQAFLKENIRKEGFQFKVKDSKGKNFIQTVTEVVEHEDGGLVVRCVAEVEGK